MPWGNKDQVSMNFVKHLNYRHKFEYDTFVVSDCILWWTRLHGVPDIGL